MSTSVSFAEIAPAGSPLRIEYQWVGRTASRAPVLVFLHEGLGSVAMWRDFPARLCEAAGLRGLVYSRPGYGRSTPRPSDERWTPRFMHEQAHEVLPALLRAVGIDAKRDELWLFGHSDGGSIALLYAAALPDALRGAIVLAPHILVEDVSVDSIRKARETYLATDLKQRLGRYHDDPDSAFWGWNDIWLDPAFRDWSIEAELDAIRCPLLAIQGLDDEYGTLEQIRGIARRVPQVQLLELADCGHSPHKDQPQAVIDAAARFIHTHAPRS
jgi:pimeloyl-ACP methyl ester carboxylesterase